MAFVFFAAITTWCTRVKNIWITIAIAKLSGYFHASSRNILKYLPKMYSKLLFWDVFFMTLRAGDWICSVVFGVKLLNVRHQNLQPCEVIVANFTGIVFINYGCWTCKIKVKISHVMSEFFAGRNDFGASSTRKGRPADRAYFSFNFGSTRSAAFRVFQ